MKAWALASGSLPVIFARAMARMQWQSSSASDATISLFEPVEPVEPVARKSLMFLMPPELGKSMAFWPASFAIRSLKEP